MDTEIVPDAIMIYVVLTALWLLFFRQIRAYPLTRSITAATGAVVVIALGAISRSPTSFVLSFRSQS